jgi:hypothetical protein
MSRSAESRRRWAYRLLRRCETPPPLYGSEEWLSLPEGDVRKVGAVIVAAEAWATEGEELPDRLRQELEAAQAAHKAAEDAEYVARREAHREEWRHLRVVRGVAYSQTDEFQSGGRSA